MILCSSFPTLGIFEILSGGLLLDSDRPELEAGIEHHTAVSEVSSHQFMTWTCGGLEPAVLASH